MTGGWTNHLIIAPILLPLVAAGLLLFIDDRRHALKATISVATVLGLLVVSIALLRFAAGAESGQPASVGVYLLGNWPAPFGIVLVLDRLSAMMLALTSVLGLAALVFALARWNRAGPYFHTLFLLLLMGLNGAFLTGDLFNLFVFFEVLLAASYGLVLHGSGLVRVKAGLHYIAINLASSFLFLIGVSLIYGVAGTLNMADLAARIPAIAIEDRAMLEAGAAILGIAFLVKAGMWPLNFWLPTAYSAAAAPAAAILAIMTKVGVYILLRLSLLLFGDGAGPSAGLGGDWLLIGGLATLSFGAIGVLASQAMGRLAGYSVLVSSGTLLAGIGIGNAGVTAGILFYLVTSTLAISAFFLLIELVERDQNPAADILAVTMEAYGDGDDEEEGEEEVGVPFQATMAILGIGFAGCGLLLAGLPPLSGFIAKFAILTAMFNPADVGGIPILSAANWTFAALLILSGLAALIAMARTGVRTFWAPIDRTVPRVHAVEIAPVAMLLLLCAVLTVAGGPVMEYMDETARALHAPEGYVDGVLTAAPVDAPAGGMGQ